MRVASSQGKDFTHNDFFLCYVRERVEVTISNMVDDTGLVRGKDRERVKGREGGEKKEGRDEKTKRPSSCQLNRGTEVTAGRGLSESLPEGGGHRVR